MVNLDASACGLPPRSLAALLDELEISRGAPLRRDMPYPAWRRLVAAAGPPAALALALLPPGDALRLPAGARRRLRDVELQVRERAPGSTDDDRAMR